MTSEITVKILCDKKRCLDILKRRFDLILQWTQVSHYWTHLSIEKKVEYKRLLDNSILVRDMHGKSKNQTELIYKQKLIDNIGNVIAEEKTSCKVENAEITNKIFQKANFKKWVTMTAEQYIFKGSELEFCVQDVKGLGLYLEMEQRENQINCTLSELIEIVKNFGLPLGNDFVGIKLPYELYLMGIK